MPVSFLKTAVATARQVVWPYEVYQRDEDGEIVERLGHPERTPTGTWTARVLSVIASATAIKVGLEELGIPVGDFIKGLFGA